MAAPDGIKSLDVILTAGCNLRCSYCYQNDKKARRMDWETLRASMDLLLRSRQPEVRLSFIGGEPLLEFPLIRRAVAYVEEARPPGTRVAYDIITNGTLLGEEQAAFLVEHDFTVQLSFDGVPAAQEFRGRGTFGVLDRLLDQLRCRRYNFFRDKLSISLTLLVETIPYVADSIAYFLDKGVQEILISPRITHQPNWRNEQIDDLDREFARVFEVCLGHFHRTGEVPLAVFHKESDQAPVGHFESLTMCGAGSGEHPAIDVDGQMVGCVTFAESYQTFPTAFLRSRLEAMRMGDLRDAALLQRMAAYPAAARAAGLFHNKQNKYSTYGRCGECRYLRSCGVCPTSIGHLPGNTDPNRVPDYLCAYNLVTQKYRERFPRVPALRDLLLGVAPVPTLVRELDVFADRMESARLRVQCESSRGRH